MRSLRTTLSALALGLLALQPAGRPATADARDPGWTGAWSAAPQRPSTGFEPNWSEAGFSRQSVRQTVRVTTGGKAVRIRLSNAYGTSPVTVTAATIARARTGAELRADSVRRLTFGRSRSVSIPAGREVRSDAVPLRVSPLESLTMTLYFAGTTGPATFHSQAYATTYRATGDHAADPTAAAFTEKTHSWYYLSGIETAGGPARRGAIVALGDSITDGFGSGTDANHRYPDELAARLTALGRNQAVLNAGIGGNLLLNDSAWYGERSTARFRRDVLGQPGVGTVIVLEGVNDIGFSEVDKPTYKPNPPVSAGELIAGYRALIRQAHARHVRVIGATLPPMKGSDHYSARAEDKRERVNSWIRASGAFDAVADFDRALADPSDTLIIRKAYDSGDHLHPNDAGYHAMAQAIDPDRL
ncbi:SGNH/GDSL hydrolase family protein [Actinoallomurus acanthiterrae]